MPVINRSHVEVWKSRFRRKYAADTAALGTLCDEIAAEAGEMVTFTSTSEDGESAGAVVTGNKMEMLAACEELLGDPLFMAGLTQPRPRILQPDFSRAQA